MQDVNKIVLISVIAGCKLQKPRKGQISSFKTVMVFFFYVIKYIPERRSPPSGFGTYSQTVAQYQ